MGSGSDSLYVSNLSYSTDNEGLREVFNGCSSAEVVCDRATGRSKGFGFVRFDSVEQAQAALDNVGGPGSTVSINERDAKVDYAYPKEQRGGGGGFGAGSGSGSGSGSDSLYVSNLSYSTDNEGLREAFDGCINAEVVYDRSTNESRGFGFVQFETAELAQAALDDLGGPGATVSIGQRDAKVFPKEQRGGGGRGGRGGGFRGGRGGGYNNQRGQRSGYGQGGY